LEVPEIVLANLDQDLARTEPDPEIHALIHDSAGLNLALDFLPGAATYDPVAQALPADLASRIVWFDAYVTNVDRTARNTNMLMWHRRLWLIDHGATLYFHHSPGWESEAERARKAFPAIREHVLLRDASALAEIDEAQSARLTRDVLEGIVDMVPSAWLTTEGSTLTAAEVRSAYVAYLVDRLVAPRPFLREAVSAR
jgi:hypothetical protein